MNGKDERSSKKQLSRGEMLALWREQKGKSKKENCHPLLSRKRPLSQIVASPSFKPSTKDKPKLRQSLLIKSTSQEVQQKAKRRTIHAFRPTVTGNQEEQQKAKRKTIHAFRPTLTSPKCTVPGRKERRGSLTDLSKTPWKNQVLSQRERLDLWLAAKGKTPYSATPHMKSKTPAKSPHPLRAINQNKQKISQPFKQPVFTQTSQREDRELKENMDSKSLDEMEDEIKNLMMDAEKPIEEVQMRLDSLCDSNKNVVHLSDYWICRARLAARENDVQRVICLLEQAYTFEAKPEEKIREEICQYLQSLESDESQDDEPNCFRPSDYAVTPGRKVHFAVADSPVDFKSSIIRFCIVESKAFKRRLNRQLKKKVMTPVRRSNRLRLSDIPNFLRHDSRLIDSPTQVEDDIIDGHIGFVPNNALNTPLNKGWLIDDTTSQLVAEKEDNDDLELSFM